MVISQATATDFCLSPYNSIAPVQVNTRLLRHKTSSDTTPPTAISTIALLLNRPPPSLHLSTTANLFTVHSPRHSPYSRPSSIRSSLSTSPVANGVTSPDSATVADIIIPISPERAGSTALPASRVTSIRSSPRKRPNGLRRKMGSCGGDQAPPRQLSNGVSNGHANGHGHANSTPELLRPHFEKLRQSLGDDTASRADVQHALVRFVDSLPPYYMTAARHFVVQQRERGIAVNVDGLAEYFAQLDKAASMASPKMSPSQCAEKDISPVYLPPVKLPPRKSGPDSSPQTELRGFSPSRPQLANLLLQEDDSTSVKSERSGTSI